jgi:hypothetical protein
MANYYYYVEVYSCRDKHETQAVGTKDYRRETRDSWKLQHTATGVADDAEGLTSLLSAFDDALPGAPQHIKSIMASGTGSLRAAIEDCANDTDWDTVSAGAWSERVGKDVFAYRLGLDTTFITVAKANAVSKDLA